MRGGMAMSRCCWRSGRVCRCTSGQTAIRLGPWQRRASLRRGRLSICWMMGFSTGRLARGCRYRSADAGGCGGHACCRREIFGAAVGCGAGGCGDSARGGGRCTAERCRWMSDGRGGPAIWVIRRQLSLGEGGEVALPTMPLHFAGLRGRRALRRCLRGRGMRRSRRWPLRITTRTPRPMW